MAQIPVLAVIVGAGLALLPVPGTLACLVPVALVASLIPARRAATVRPVEALRHQ